MRKLILLAVLPMACIATQVMANPGRMTDSTRISHANDGDITEWGSGNFETDPVTKVLYAVDHDKDYMYMAVKVTDPAMQMRMSMAGMKMFIDTRGKNKQGTGVEFPMRREGGGGGGFRGGGGPGADVPEAARMQQRMAFNMIMLKSFGFDDKEDKSQFIGEAGGINIAFAWDADGTLGLEYKVPLEFIGDASSLKNKAISIGWKINEGGPYNMSQGGGKPGSGGGGQSSSSAEATTVSAPVSAGSAAGGGRRSGGGGRTAAMGDGGQRPTAEADPKGQFMWAKHVMNF